MAGFKQHISGGVAVGAIASVVALEKLQLSISQGCVAFILAMLGSILPDIDSDTSTPVKMLFGYLGIILPVAIIHIFYPQGTTMETLILVIVTGYFITKDIVASIFFRFTSHRGIIHSIPAGIVCCQITFFMFKESANSARILFAGACFTGYIIHLIMDEIWSIDLMGATLKKSFGSAITFTGNTAIQTIAIYSLILILFFAMILLQ